MTTFKANQPDGHHRCDNCDATYEVAWQRRPISLPDSAKCHCCKSVMARWNSANYPIFLLIGECPSLDKQQP